MKITTVTHISIALIFLFASCTNNNKTQRDTVNFKDTLYRSNTIVSNSGDTIRQQDTIYFSPTDVTIDTSRFFYEAAERRQLKENTFRVYFPREKVIAYCDSMLKTFPTNPAEEDLYKKNLYTTLKEQATENKRHDVQQGPEFSTLLERFNPYILNPFTGEKPAYIIITKQQYNTAELKVFQIKNKMGDTITLTAALLKPIALKEVEDE